MQQIAVGPNKRCTVEPCGSTDSFYRSHKEQLWKTKDLFTPVGASAVCPITSQTVTAQVVKLGFIHIHKGIFCFCVLPPHVDEQRMI